MPTTLTLQPTGQLLTVPTKWADVSLAQFIDLHAPGADDARRPAEVLLGLEAGGLDQLAADDVRYLSNLLAFAQDASDVLALLPTPGLPEVGTLPYGTLLLAQQRIAAEHERPWLSYGAHLLALYRITLLHGSAVASKVAACEAALLAAPVTEVYADAAFFLSSYKNWQAGTPPTPKTPLSPKMRKLTRAANTSGTGSGRFSAWIRRLAAPS